MVDVSVILPVYNAEKWLDQTLHSVLQQSFEGQFELSIYNDASTDSSLKIIETWTDKLQSSYIPVKVEGHASETPRGVGYAKNRAVEQSSGNFLCFLDADDIMHKDRLCYQYEAAKSHPDCIVGSQFVRDPPGSTERFTKWANEMTQEQLITQAYTSHGPTLIMPTWFCSRTIYNRVGGFDEGGKGTPEDLMFFYKHLELGGGIYRVDRELITYRYHQEAATFYVHEETIWKLRVQFLQQQVISKWQTFTIWNAGKQGRKLYRSLSPENQKKVCAFCDVDEKKISKQFYIYEESKQIPIPKIPITHFKDARPPFIICMKLKYHQSVKQFGFRSGYNLFAKVISRRH